MERPVLKLPLPVKVAINTGACLDIPTGDWIKGTHGQYILNGGVGSITGIVGPGNSGKTTLMRFMEFSALNRIWSTVKDFSGLSYDTEVNTHENRNKSLYSGFENIKDEELIDQGVWQFTDKTEYAGNEFFEVLKSYLRDKRKERNPYKYATAFLDRDGVNAMKVMPPSISDFDSLSHFVTADVEKIMDTTELGDSAANTLFMRQGLAKSRMLMELPTLAGGHGHYILFTAHIGTQILMPSGPGTPPPRKQLQHMSQGEVIKGVTNNFFYLLHNCWLVTSSSPYLNQGTKAPEYPYEPGDEVAGDLDLSLMKVKQLRGKNGSSGFIIEILMSQKEGVLPGLTEFHYIKNMDRYGLEGSNTNYNLVLCPHISLSRTKVRKAIRENKDLQRALEITSQLCQMYEFQRELRPLLMTPAEIYKALSEKGYDWNFILNETRGWHTFDDEKAPLYPLSTYDLCRIARGTYHPYWLEEDCKTVKKEYKKLKETK